MTTHDDRVTTVQTHDAQPEFSSAAAEHPVEHEVSPVEPNDAASFGVPAESQHAPPVVDATRAEAVPQRAEGQPSDDELLFAADTSGLRSRWDDIQAVFVDDPADCVQKADALVAEVVDQLTSAFSEARSRLEGQLARGEQVSTEDLRLALQRYREFFQRLLAV